MMEPAIYHGQFWECETPHGTEWAPVEYLSETPTATVTTRYFYSAEAGPRHPGPVTIVRVWASKAARDDYVAADTLRREAIRRAEATKAAADRWRDDHGHYVCCPQPGTGEYWAIVYDEGSDTPAHPDYVGRLAVRYREHDSDPAFYGRRVTK